MILSKKFLRKSGQDTDWLKAYNITKKCEPRNKMTPQHALTFLLWIRNGAWTFENRQELFFYAYMMIKNGLKIAEIKKMLNEPNVSSNTDKELIYWLVNPPTKKRQKKKKLSLNMILQVEFNEN